MRGGISGHLRRITRWWRKLHEKLHTMGGKKFAEIFLNILMLIFMIILVLIIILRIAFRLPDNIVGYLIASAFLYLLLVIMFALSIAKVLKIAPEVIAGELLERAKHDFFECVEVGFLLLIRVGLMSLAPITIITAVLPLGSFKTVFSFCIAASVLVAACFALSDYENIEDPPRKFIDRFGKELHEWVPFGRHVKTGIDPHDMWLIALPVITAAAATATIVYALAFIIRTYMNIWPSLLTQVLVSILVLLIFIVPPVTVWAFRRRNTRKIRSEKVKKHFTALMVLYTMIIIPPIISLMTKYNIIIISIPQVLKSSTSLAYMVAMYLLAYLAIVNSLRYAGLITEKLPTTNKENQKT